jgi:hypothetical protein
MGAPTSAILSESFLQYLEHNQILEILKKHKIIAYYRYVDDIFILCNTNHTNINSTPSELNCLHEKLQFAMENEYENKLNYLDLTITRTSHHLYFEIYIKPTATSTILHHNSWHTIEHKMAGIQYLINKVNAYQILAHSKDMELQRYNTSYMLTTITISNL